MIPLIPIFLNSSQSLPIAIPTYPKNAVQIVAKSI